MLAGALEWYQLYKGEFYSIGTAVIWSIGVVIFRICGDYVGPMALNQFKKHYWHGGFCFNDVRFWLSVSC